MKFYRSYSKTRPARSCAALGERRPACLGDDEGYLLFGVLILLFLFTLALSIAAPMVAKDIQRDKEEEAVQRGKQYKRAIRMYYKKFNAYPTTVAQLESTNNMRFLRKRYLDPITGKDDWRIIHVGEAKVPVLGFFGQPLQAGISSATTGLMGNGTGGLGNGSTTAGTGSTFGNSSFGSSSNGFGSSSGGFGSSSGTSTGDGTTPAAPVGVLPGMSAGAGVSGAPGSTDGSGTATQTGSTGSFGTSIASQSNSIGSGGTTGPIVGFGIALDKPSLVIYHKQDRYNKWEFTYDPIEEQMYVGSSGIPGASPVAGSSGTAGSPGTGSSTPFGSTNSPGSSTGIGFGATPAPTTNSGSSSTPN